MLGVLLLSAARVCGALAEVPESAETLVQRMVEATESLNYDGIFVYQRDGQIDSMRIIHKNIMGVEAERLISLSGPEREVLRDGTKVTVVFADDREVMVGDSPPREYLTLGLSAPLARIADYYAFTVMGQERVAGRAAHVVAVTPRNPDRYGYRLWIDRESGLLLKSVVLGDAGRVLEQVLFTQLRIGSDIPDESLKPEIQGEGFTRYTSSATAHGGGRTVPASSRWQVHWLPRGFAMRDQELQEISASRLPVTHEVYSDGLAMVSVFVEKIIDGSERLDGYSSLGAVNTFSRSTGDHQITVVGEVPMATVRAIAASVSYVETAAH